MKKLKLLLFESQFNNNFEPSYCYCNNIDA